MAISSFGIINVWLTKDETGYSGSWGYDKPMTEIKLINSE
jgi:hypothetical protein